MSKLMFDKLFSILGLLFFCPLLIVVAIVIKIKMPDGPVFFKQNRVGKLGVIFKVYKFRTMINDHSANTITILGQSRITRLGLILRRYKIDELPSLWNVLIGDMSFVGPRPDVLGYADKLKGDDKRILDLIPGITGPASLKYSNEEQLLAKVDNPKKYNDEVIFPDKVKINLEYYYKRSFYGDIKIILNTIFRVNY